MENTKSPMDKKKLLPIILAVLAVIIIVVIIVIAGRKEKGPVSEGELETPGTETATETEVEPGFQEGEELGEGTGVAEVNPVLVNAVREAPGANLISTDGQVITDDGEKIRTDVSPTDMQAPRSSLPISKEQVEETAVMLDVSATGFSPNVFTVKAGEVVTIALTSADQWSHNINFSDPILQAAETSVSAGTTRAFSFNAPSAKGEYNFSCKIPGHAGRGEVGKMIVE
jgi:plastocyanin